MAQASFTLTVRTYHHPLNFVLDLGRWGGLVWFRARTELGRRSFRIGYSGLRLGPWTVWCRAWEVAGLEAKR